ncbi:carbohydrate ABC transporter permease [Aquisalimonas asiatica]|nr:sugar ABC transporter permease [Aquisalimonas asiatica]
MSTHTSDTATASHAVPLEGQRAGDGPGRRKMARTKAPYWFLSPFFILFGTFFVFPIFFMIYLSFHVWNPAAGLSAMQWVGLENYSYALTDPTLWRSLRNTVVIALLSGVPQHLIALPAAFVLVQLGSRARHWLSVAYFTPYVTSTIAVSMIFYVIYAPHSGILNQTLIYLATNPVTGWAFTWVADVMPIRWVQDNALIQYSISAVVFWKYVGFNIIIYVAGLTTIPKDLYEAARIDGANAWQQFRFVALPMLRPFIFFAVTMTIIGNMNLFDEPYVLTRALEQASRSGMTISNYLYRVAWQWMDMGSAAAISWILFFVIAAMTWVYFHLFGRKGLEGN